MTDNFKPSPGPRPLVRAKGAALIIVLWTVAILSIIIMNFGFMVKTHLRVAANYADTNLLHNIAFAGVERAVAELKFDEEQIDHLQETWASNEEAFFEYPVGRGHFSLIRNEFGLEAGQGYGMEDEAAKLNLRTAPRDMILRLPGMDDELADALEDWQDRDSIPKTMGAESDHYESLPRPYHCKDGPLSTVHELLLVKGFDRLVVFGEDLNGNGILDPNENDGDMLPPNDNADGILDRGLFPFVTIYSVDKNVTLDDQKRVNVNSASESQLQRSIPGLKSSEARAIVAYRGKNKFQRLGDLLNVTEAPQPQNQNTNKSSSSNNSGNRNSSGNSSNRSSSNNSNNRNSSGNSSNRSSSGNSSNRSSSSNSSNRSSSNNSSSNRSSSNSGGSNRSSSNNSSNRSSNNSSSDRNSSSNSNNNRSGGSRSSTSQSTISRNSANRSAANQNRASSGSGRKIFSRGRLQQIIDYCTIDDKDKVAGKININTAPTEVLTTLPGIDQTLAESIVSYRQQPMMSFQNIAEILDVSGMSTTAFIQISNLITVRSFQFRVKSVARLEGLSAQRTAVAILDRMEDEIKTLYWNEY